MIFFKFGRDNFLNIMSYFLLLTMDNSWILSLVSYS